MKKIIPIYYYSPTKQYVVNNTCGDYLSLSSFDDVLLFCSESQFSFKLFRMYINNTKDRLNLIGYKYNKNYYSKKDLVNNYPEALI